MHPTALPDGGVLVQIASYNTNLQGNLGLPQDLVDWLAPTLQVSSFLSRSPRAPDIVAVGIPGASAAASGPYGYTANYDRAQLTSFYSPPASPSPLSTTAMPTFFPSSKHTLQQGTICAHRKGRQRRCSPACLWKGRRHRKDGMRRADQLDRMWSTVHGQQGRSRCPFSCPRGERKRWRGVHVSCLLVASFSFSSLFTRFVCAHLTAHAERLAQRIDNYNHIVGTLLFPSPSSPPTTIYSTSHLFFLEISTFAFQYHLLIPYIRSIQSQTLQPS